MPSLTLILPSSVQSLGMCKRHDKPKAVGPGASPSSRGDACAKECAASSERQDCFALILRQLSCPPMRTLSANCFRSCTAAQLVRKLATTATFCEQFTTDANTRSIAQWLHFFVTGHNLKHHEEAAGCAGRTSSFLPLPHPGPTPLSDPPGGLSSLPLPADREHGAAPCIL